MSERLSKRESIIPTKDWELLQRRLLTDFRRIKLLGIVAGGVISDINDNNLGLMTLGNTSRLFFAASSNKTAVATCVIDTPSLDQGGNTALRDQLDKMLRYSDNDATKQLVKAVGGASTINDCLEAKGYKSTRLEPVVLATGEPGFYMGVTTPNESLRLLRELLNSKGPLADVARKSLAGTDSKYGVRPRAAQEKDILLYSKSGQYNGDEDLPGVRHDTGLIIGLGGKTLGYSLMTEFRDNRLQAWLADRFIGQIGANMLEAVGGRGRVRRGIASRAIRAAGWKS